MKNWKKAAAMAVTASLCITALAGCGGSSKTEEKTDSTEKKSASDNTLHYPKQFKGRGGLNDCSESDNGTYIEYRHRCLGYTLEYSLC